MGLARAAQLGDQPLPHRGVGWGRPLRLALGLLEGGLARQAVAEAYVDVFGMLMLAFVVFLPFVSMLSPGLRKGGGAPAKAQ